MSAGQPVPEGARLDPGGTGGGAYLSRVDFLGRNNNLNAVCLVAAAAVLWSHSWPLAGARGGDALTRILPGTTAGAIAVNVFFGLSGFLIARSYLGSRSVGSYVLSRVSRIYPALVVCVLLCMLLAATISTAPVDPAKYWAYFKYNASAVAMPYRLPGVFGDNPHATINGSLWTLTFEVRMYLVCMAVGMVGLLARRDLMTALALLVLLGFLSSSTLTAVFLDGKANAMPCAAAFLIGMVLCVNRDRIPWSPLGGIVALVLLFVFWNRPWVRMLYLPVLVYFALAIGLMSGGARTIGWFRSNDLSYGLYLYAYPVQQVFVMLGVRDPVALFAAALPVTVLFALASWYLVERPSMRVFRRLDGALALRQADRRVEAWQYH
jgi:peptidoglycan/LPS O-acetylase OafA/YrhL